ncbi:C-terminal binding protein [Roseibium sp.]|uniref:C-terminal binding protein n=1 Tax=Roseibium sp. TaxID=1936156 RepID=UPI003A96DF40
MSRLRLLTPDAQYPDDAKIERATAGNAVDWDIFRERSTDRLPDDALRSCDAMVVWHEMPVTRELISKLQRCKIIVRAGVGFDHIDLQAAAEAGIPVCNTPDYGTSEVADHAMALMLTMRRGISSYHRNLMQSPQAGFDHSKAPLLARLRGKTFGVIGLGRIGIAASLRAKAFGMRVLAYDPLVSRGTEIAAGVDRCDHLEELLEQSDVVSLHCPLTAETNKMINAERLAMMQSHAVLINTARGAIIDVEALLEALRQGTIAGAGIDVLPVEPPSETDAIALAYANGADPIVGERLFVTPHAAWSSPESVSDARRLSVETAMQFLNEGRLRNLVNSPLSSALSGAA